MVVADSRNWACLPEMGPESGPNADQVEAALEKLQVVLLKEDAGELDMSGDSKEGSLSVGASSSDHKEVIKAEASTSGSPFRLERDKKWLESTVARLESILSVNLPLVSSPPVGSFLQCAFLYLLTHCYVHANFFRLVNK